MVNPCSAICRIDDYEKRQLMLGTVGLVGRDLILLLSVCPGAFLMWNETRWKDRSFWPIVRLIPFAFLLLTIALTSLLVPERVPDAIRVPLVRHMLGFSMFVWAVVVTACIYRSYRFEYGGDRGGPSRLWTNIKLLLTKRRD